MDIEETEIANVFAAAEMLVDDGNIDIAIELLRGLGLLNEKEIGMHIDYLLYPKYHF